MSEALDPALLAELSGIFRQEAAERLDVLRRQVDALQNPDAQDLADLFTSARREAHTIKGSAGTVGADELRSVALRLEKRLELYGREGRPLGEDDGRVLRALCGRLETALAAF